MNKYLIRSLGRAVLVIALVASGWYTALSLYWWEWQRAFFYGLTFVAALVVVLFLVLQARLDRLERQLAQSDSGRADANAGSEEIPTTPERGFAWLNPGQGTFVFVPLLVGFGVVVSALAVAVERVAGFVVGPDSDGGGTAGRGGQQRGPRRLLTIALGAVLVAALVVALLVPLVGAAVYAPGAPEPGQRALEVQVRGARVETDPVAAVTTLAGYCRTQTRAPVEIDSVRSIGPDTVQLTVHPRLHPDDQRRFEGCLGDRVLDRHIVRVMHVREVADEAP